MNILFKELKEAEKYKDEFDYLKNGKVALTSSNAYKVEAFLRIDSNYRNTHDINKKPDYNFIKYLSGNLNLTPSNRIKEKGSSSYWINELRKLLITKEKVEYDIDIILKGIICTIDIENSTHLSSRNNFNLSKEELDKAKGRERVFEKIKQAYFTDSDKLNEYRSFIDSINNPESNQYKIIEIIAKPDLRYKAEKNHFSFATKFCRYVCLGLNTKIDDNGSIVDIDDCGDKYYIYDSVIMNNLNDYIEGTIGLNILNEEEITILKNKEFYTMVNDNYSVNYGKHYAVYLNLLDKIRNYSKDKISRNAFDHIIWYLNK